MLQNTKVLCRGGEVDQWPNRAVAHDTRSNGESPTIPSRIFSHQYTRLDHALASWHGKCCSHVCTDGMWSYHAAWETILNGEFTRVPRVQYYGASGEETHNSRSTHLRQRQECTHIASQTESQPNKVTEQDGEKGAQLMPGMIVILGRNAGGDADEGS